MVYAHSESLCLGAMSEKDKEKETVQETEAEKGGAAGDASGSDSPQISAKAPSRRETQTAQTDPVLLKLEQQQQQLDRLRKQNQVILKRLKRDDSKVTQPVTPSRVEPQTKDDSEDIFTWIWR